LRLGRLCLARLSLFTEVSRGIDSQLWLSSRTFFILSPLLAGGERAVRKEAIAQRADFEALVAALSDVWTRLTLLRAA
jgi:hypothetical protein